MPTDRLIIPAYNIFVQENYQPLTVAWVAGQLDCTPARLRGAIEINRKDATNPETHRNYSFIFVWISSGGMFWPVHTNKSSPFNVSTRHLVQFYDAQIKNKKYTLTKILREEAQWKALALNNIQPRIKRDALLRAQQARTAAMVEENQVQDVLDELTRLSRNRDL